MDSIVGFASVKVTELCFWFAGVEREKKESIVCFSSDWTVLLVCRCGQKFK